MKEKFLCEHFLESPKLDKGKLPIKRRKLKISKTQSSNGPRLETDQIGKHRKVFFFTNAHSRSVSTTIAAFREGKVLKRVEEFNGKTIENLWSFYNLIVWSREFNFCVIEWNESLLEAKLKAVKVWPERRI